MAATPIASSSADLAGKVAFDANSLNDLKRAARDESPEAIKAVAKQFEAIFMNMMLKSMRDATPQDSPFENEQTRTFTSMLDQQLSSNLANKGMGLADVLAKQLSKTANIHPDLAAQSKTGGAISAQDLVRSLPHMQMLTALDAGSDKESTQDNPIPMLDTLPNADMSVADALSQDESAIDYNSSSNQIRADFNRRMYAHAQAASDATGIPAHLMLGQAALETGWGRRELKGIDGKNSYNLFGMKATGNWQGKVVEATTTEYVNGVKQKRVEKFRAYDNYAESFKDFANMMRNNPRYENVVNSVQNINQYARAMQQAGYATDPNYATKLANVIQKVSSG